MKQKRLKTIAKCFLNGTPTMTIKELFDNSESIDFSYKTFFRGASILAEKNLIELGKISRGRGTGVNLEIQNIYFEQIWDFLRGQK